MRPGFRIKLRAVLIQAAREQAAAPTPILTRIRQRVDDTTARWRYSTSVAAATASAALALSAGGVAVAAEHALPNEPFYSVKLPLEDLRLALISDPVARAEQRLAYAAERLREAEIMANVGDEEAAARALAEAVKAYRLGAGELRAASREQSDPSLLAPLDEWTSQSRERLEGLAPLLNGAGVLPVEDVPAGPAGEATSIGSSTISTPAAEDQSSDLVDSVVDDMVNKVTEPAPPNPPSQSRPGLEAAAKVDQP
jgi:hypothetical protein